MRVTLLGTGTMGVGMARSLLRAGHQVTVWNRSTEKARPLADDGAIVADSPAAAVRDAEAVVTMLFDTDAVLAVVAGTAGSWQPHAIWVQASTIGLDGTARAAAWADKHGIAFVDAPVLGTRNPAAEGKLVVLASGEAALRERAQPVFDAIGGRTVWAGDSPGAASALKLAANAYVATLNAAVGQSVALAGALGLSPTMFLDAIRGGPVDSPYAQAKGAMMIGGEFDDAQFAVAGVTKDVGLVRDAVVGSGTGMSTALIDAVAQAYRLAEADQRGQQDMAAVVTSFVPDRS
jgi:3-hydroxyisobutyrate dehydrogenase